MVVVLFCFLQKALSYYEKILDVSNVYTDVKLFVSHIRTLF